MMRQGILWMLVFMLCGSCAVHWSLRPQAPTSQKIFLPLPDNTSLSSGVDIEYYTALKNRLIAERGLSLVETKSEADRYLLIRLSKVDLRKGPTSFTGNQETEGLGGLANDFYTAASLNLAVEVALESRNARSGVIEWVRTYKKESQLEAANRLLESEGASSLPIINESRVQIFHKKIAADFARVSVDQLLEDF